MKGARQQPATTRKRIVVADEPEVNGIGLKPAGLTPVEQVTFQKLFAAIAERRLLPGVRLVEDELANVFAVTRERVRRILLVLSQHGIVRLEPNRGAYVARPTHKERRDAFEARRLVEQHVISVLCALSPSRRRVVARHLCRHIKAEAAAVAARDRVAQIRLSGEFHLKIAAYAGNQRLVWILQDVITQMSLAMAAHTHGPALECSLGEHVGLVAAIGNGDAREADRLLAAHLDHIEVALGHGLQDDGDLAAVLGK
jgi:DNA-binding GntR family transcriptional regulator